MSEPIPGRFLALLRRHMPIAVGGVIIGCCCDWRLPAELGGSGQMERWKSYIEHLDENKSGLSAHDRAFLADCKIDPDLKAS